MHLTYTFEYQNAYTDDWHSEKVSVEKVPKNGGYCAFTYIHFSWSNGKYSYTDVLI
ncbi:MAG: hypothetical protein LBD03_07970 [Methanobrevibacter sp.]|nr:hypothetical protein [Candidatus Methanovirga procula]